MKKKTVGYENFLNTSIFWLNVHVFSSNDKILFDYINTYSFLDKKVFLQHFSNFIVLQIRNIKK